MADNFAERGYEVIRYSLEPEYFSNKDTIKTCGIVFIAVPTPTTPNGYDSSIIRKVIPLVGKNKIIVLKSTILISLTRTLQNEFPDYVIIHSPEFLSEATVVQDIANPFVNIVGIPIDSDKHKHAAELVHAILPKAPESVTVTSDEAELIKYCHNCSGYTQIIFFNLMYDIAQKLGADWRVIEKAVKADPFVSNRYVQPVHKSGRGAGGHCFPKDFEALLRFYQENIKDEKGLKVLESIRDKNVELLLNSGKDRNLLAGVYNISNAEK